MDLNKTELKQNAFQLEGHDFIESRPLPRIIVLNDEQPTSGKYFLGSVLLHGAIAFSALLASFLMLNDEPKMESLEIDLLDPGISSSPTAPLAEVPTSPAQDEAVSEPVKAKTPAPVPNVIEAAKPVAKVMAMPPATPKAAIARPAAVQAFRQDSPVVVPDNIDDIQAPDLETPSVQPVVPPQKALPEEELSQDFAQVDEAHDKKVAILANKINQETDEALDENEALAQEAEAETQAEAEKISAYNAARRAQDAQAIAAAQAAEQLAAARAAQQRAAVEKAARGGGHGEGQPHGVRSLDQLRQMPGNPVPQYDAQERLQRQAGDVVFVAYVNSDGRLSSFKMLQSTGHRNLDAKTLAALKKWRFYGGQEGWVELPFRWDLKGGAKEMPALLRRK